MSPQASDWPACAPPPHSLSPGLKGAQPAPLGIELRSWAPLSLSLSLEDADAGALRAPSAGPALGADRSDHRE